MTQTEQTVLIVDDETYVLRSLQRVLRNETFRLITASSGSEALTLLENESVDLIISDLRMPGMDGSELLAKVADIYPGMPRILLSGNADLPSVIKTVNEGQLSYYFQKPWDDDAMRLTLRGFLHRKQLEEMEQELTVKIQEQNEELLRLNEQLEKQSELIREEGEIKSRFFSTMSHEIRTPLNGLLGVLQLVRNGDSTTSRNQSLIETSYATALDLKRLADDVLDYSKLTSDNMEFESIAFEPQSCISPIQELMTPLAMAKGLTLNVSNAFDDHLLLAGDPVRIRQIVSNLVSNAIKFTETGEINLQATFSSGELNINVTDTGIGISDDRMDFLFEEFKMLDPAHHRKYGGTGLGLSIARRLTQQMNGNINVTSEVGKGTCFTVTLPLTVSTDDTLEVAAEEQTTQLAGRHFLVVDDNEANLLVVKSAVEAAGAIAVTALDGLAAIRILQQPNTSFDAILLDINMPGIDGAETLSIIREDSLAGCPIYALTAQVEQGARQRFEQAGFDEIVSKPLDLKQLRRLLETLPRKIMNIPTSKNQGTLKEPAQAADFNKSAFDELIKSTGQGTAKPLVDSFIRDCEKRVPLIKSAVAEANNEAIAAQAHALNNSAAMFGATSLHKLCQKINSDYLTTGMCDPEDSMALLPLITASTSTVSTWLSSMQQHASFVE